MGLPLSSTRPWPGTWLKSCGGYGRRSGAWNIIAEREISMAKEIRELVAVTARIEERTVAILAAQKSLNDRLPRHEDEDRTDFSEFYHTLSLAERKVNCILGIVSGIIFLVTVLGTFT